MADKINYRTGIFYLILMIATCSPIWSVGYFINQDGSGHLHTAYIMAELLKGNETLGQFYTFNSISVPNASGHYLLMVLLQLFSSFTVTKIMVTLTYAVFVLATGWLRLRTVGDDGVKTSLLIGAAMGFNWLWLVGFYNFIIGVIVFLLTIGLYFRWRERVTAPNTIGLSALLLFAYLSHIVSFLILAGGVLVLAAFASRSSRAKAVLFACLAYIPVVPLAVMWKRLSDTGEGFAPVWRSIRDPYSISNWIYQIRVVDPFIIISRKAFPFITETSNFHAIFTPALWLFIAFTALAAATFFYFRANRAHLREFFPFILLAVGSLLLGALGPDDFQQTNGGCLRERFLICGMLFFVPVFRVGGPRILKSAAQFCLIVVIVFQTMAVWDYALNSNSQAAEFMAGAEQLRSSRSTILVTFENNSLRYHANTIPQLNCYNGISTDNIVWDNYEFGHYLFPLVTKSEADRRFIHDLTTSQFYSLDNPSDGYEDRYYRLESSLSAYNERIDTLAIWGEEPRVEELLQRWFEREPYFQSGRLRLFRHR